MTPISEMCIRDREEESQHLATLGDLIGKPISLQVESAYMQNQYDVILM